MLKKLSHIILSNICIAVSLTSCDPSSLNEAECNDGKVPIGLSALISQEYVTRADSHGFTDGDVISTYIVDYENGMPGQLKDKGNRADNLFYTFNEPGNRWIPAYNVYYKDDKTAIDIYAYYPASNPESVSQFEFEVALDQSAASDSGLSAYEQSDFLWAKAENKTSSDKTVWLDFSHRMAGIRVELQEGSGFDEGEWAQARKSVLVRNTARAASINLSNGSVCVIGEQVFEGIVPQKEGDSFRAVVVPQMVSAGKTLISVTIGGSTYDYQRGDDMVYSAGKLHNFTLTVNKRSDGELEFSIAGVNISEWDNDKYSHEGAAKEYVIVNVSTPGTIDAIIAASGCQISKVRNLKVTGKINSRDFEVMKDKMTNLSSLNLKEAIIVADGSNSADRIPTRALCYKSNLISIILPDRLRTIGEFAFAHTNISGSLIIPEGVVTLEDGCFAECASLSGHLYLPSTLKHIGTSTDKNESVGVFIGCNFVCELNLPEGLETIGSAAFCRCRNIYGELHIPESVTSINYRSFAFMNGISGSVRIPQNILTIPEDCFCESGFNGNLILHDGILTIERSAFKSTDLKGELHLPKNMEVINADAFSSCDFSGSLAFPESIRHIGDRAFQGNRRLMGTIEIPEGVMSIGSKAFYNCSMLEGVVFPESLENILDSEGGAFENCFNLGRIVCKSRIPPKISDVCFKGVSKDNFVLEVPQGSEQQYRVAKGWNSFKRISASRHIAASRSVLSAINTAVTRKFTLHADGPWKVVSYPDWVRPSAVSGDGKTELTLSFSQKPQDGKKRIGEIVFSLESDDYQTALKLEQYDFDNPEDAVIQLQKASVGRAANIVILCDGYSAEEVSQGKAMSCANEARDHLFSLSPFSTFKDRFNVWTAVSVSMDSGVNSLNSSLETRFGSIATDGSVKCGDKGRIIDYVRSALAFDEGELSRTLILVLPNTDDYDGSAYFDASCLGIAYCPKSSNAYPMDFRGMVQYWAGGRVFGRLADESVRTNSFFSDSQEVLDAQSKGWYRNVSLSGKTADTAWKDFASHKSYSSFVDVFEGAMTCSRGIYRSEQSSCMSTRIAYYNTIGRFEIMRRIFEYSGEEFSLERFIDNDIF